MTAWRELRPELRVPIDYARRRLRSALAASDGAERWPVEHRELLHESIVAVRAGLDQLDRAVSE